MEPMPIHDRDKKEWLSTSQWMYLLLFSTILCSGVLVYNFSNQLADCSPAPFLYVTLHDEPHNVIKMSRNGCIISTSTLEREKNSYLRYIETGAKHILSKARLRTMAAGKYKGLDALYVANAKAGRDEILVYSGRCDRFGKRRLLARAVTKLVDGDFVDTEHTSIAMEHPYGLTFDAEGNLYVSTQHTDLVLRYRADTFAPLSAPDLSTENPPKPELISSEFSLGSTSLVTNVAKQVHNGSFVDFSNLNDHRVYEGVRGIAYVDGHIWIAHENINGIVVADISTGIIRYVIAVEKPISLLLDNDRGVVFVGVKGRRSQSATVYAVDVSTMKITKAYNHNNAKHATGIVLHEDTLFVADQGLSSIILFDVNTGEYKGKLRHLPYVEDLMLSDC